MQQLEKTIIVLHRLGRISDGEKGDHDICNVSLGDSLASPIEPDAAWGTLVAPGNTVGALEMNTFSFLRKSDLSFCLLTGVSAVKTPVSKSRYPPAQFVRL